MAYKHASVWVALAALLVCSACGEKSSTMTLVTPTSQQAVAIKWDEAVASGTTARVSNTSLIFMR